MHKPLIKLFMPSALPSSQAEAFGHIVVTVLLITSVTPVQADDQLMQPVQDIHFQELPPPWESLPSPTRPIARIPTKNTPPITPKTNTLQKGHLTNQKTPISKTTVATPLTPTTTTPKLSDIDALKAAANSNDSDAQYNLGMRYQYGNGVKKSRNKAHHWLNKSAESGNARAQYALSLFYQRYARNQQGIKKALLWLKRAADQGLANAQYSLGIMFKNGSLVYKNPYESKKWLRLAASQGHTAAQLALK